MCYCCRKLLSRDSPPVLKMKQEEELAEATSMVTDHPTTY